MKEEWKSIKTLKKLKGVIIINSKELQRTLKAFKATLLTVKDSFRIKNTDKENSKEKLPIKPEESVITRELKKLLDKKINS